MRSLRKVYPPGTPVTRRHNIAHKASVHGDLEDKLAIKVAEVDSRSLIKRASDPIGCYLFSWLQVKHLCLCKWFNNSHYTPTISVCQYTPSN